jgi:hypothetical protein
MTMTYLWGERHHFVMEVMTIEDAKQIPKQLVSLEQSRRWGNDISKRFPLYQAQRKTFDAS